MRNEVVRSRLVVEKTKCKIKGKEGFAGMMHAVKEENMLHIYIYIYICWTTEKRNGKDTKQVPNNSERGVGK